MRYVTFRRHIDSPEQVGALRDTEIVPLPFPSMQAFLQAGPDIWRDVPEMVLAGRIEGVALADVHLRAPLPNPSSLRDFYAFEEHVATANANRGREVPPAWYDMPVFYFSNHQAVMDPGQDVSAPPGSQALDYELEVAAIVGIAGKDIPVHQAMTHVFGFTIYNDWSARDLQRQEMSVGLGPAKGKDFAQGMGPWIITPDELADRSTGRPGVYDLAMVARINGVTYSQGNWRDLFYSFGEMIARASSGVSLHPGDVIGSGTVGTGCLLEITRGRGPWLQPGDVVELEIERLGCLSHPITTRTPGITPA